jgi:phosphate transport system substrate-binding protein
MLKQGSNLVSEVGYVPLPQNAYDLAWKHFESRKLGTVFGGHNQVGITIEQLLAMEAKL